MSFDFWIKNHFVCSIEIPMELGVTTLCNV
jgi:hypothetical protein